MEETSEVQKNPFAPRKSKDKDGKDKKPSVRQVWFDRMKREGRDKEWFERCRQKREETGKGFWAVSWEVMREMGYIDSKDEWAKHKEYMTTVHKSAAVVEREKIQDEIRVERLVADFEEAVRLLPDKSPVAEEIDWIRSHPAMSRKARSKVNENVMIDANDILYAPHGRAPSKAAVYQLQHWANNPNEFYKQLLTEQKKQTDEGGDRKSGRDAGLDEVERLLEEVRRDTGLGEVVQSTPQISTSGGTLAADAERGRSDRGAGGPAEAVRDTGPVAAPSSGVGGEPGPH